MVCNRRRGGRGKKRSDDAKITIDLEIRIALRSASATHHITVAALLEGTHWRSFPKVDFATLSRHKREARIEWGLTTAKPEHRMLLVRALSACLSSLAPRAFKYLRGHRFQKVPGDGSGRGRGSFRSCVRPDCVWQSFNGVPSHATSHLCSVGEYIPAVLSRGQGLTAPDQRRGVRHHTPSVPHRMPRSLASASVLKANGAARSALPCTPPCVVSVTPKAAVR